MSHYDAPWTVIGHAGGGHIIVSLSEEGPMVRLAEVAPMALAEISEGNARLMAAAPEMHGSLRKMRDELNALLGLHNVGCECSGCTALDETEALLEELL